MCFLKFIYDLQKKAPKWVQNESVPCILSRLLTDILIIIPNFTMYRTYFFKISLLAALKSC